MSHTRTLTVQKLNKLWITWPQLVGEKKHLRFGQFVVCEHPELGPCPDIFYEEVAAVAYAKLMDIALTNQD